MWYYLTSQLAIAILSTTDSFGFPLVPIDVRPILIADSSNRMFTANENAKRFRVLLATAALVSLPTGTAAANAVPGYDDAPSKERYQVSQSDQPAAEQPAPDGGLEENGTVQDDDQTMGEVSIGEIPVVQTTELTAEKTRKAIDAYVMVREKYKDAELENYEDLQEFVDQNKDGKAFEADVKAAGFATVNDWNLVIVTASLAYANIVDEQTDEINQQIDDIKDDTEMAQDMKDRLIASMQALIPSENNRKVVEAVMADPAYSEKIKQLEVEGSGEVEPEAE